MSEYVSMADLPRLDEYSNAEIADRQIPWVVWGLNAPPYIDEERLEVNKSAWTRLQKVGAMTASVVLEYQGDTTQFTPGINSVNAFGEATATKAGVTTKADKSKSTIIRPYEIPKILEDRAGRPVVLHKINKSELASDTSDAIRGGAESRAGLDGAAQPSYPRFV